MKIKLTFRPHVFNGSRVPVLEFLDIRTEAGDVIEGIGVWAADGEFEELTLDVNDVPDQPTLPIDGK